MSISSRITAIEEHIENAYDKFEDLGVDLTSVNRNINNIADMLEDVYEEYPKITATGVTEATLDNTKAGKMELNLKGNTYQEQIPAEAGTTVTGEGIISVNDVNTSKEFTLNFLGNTIQNGTPTPTSPIDIETITGNISLKISDSEEQQEQIQTLTLPTGMELCKIGDFKDRIYKDNGKWYLEKKINKIVFNGTETQWTVEKTGDYYRFNFTEANMYNYNGRGQYAISNYFYSTTTNDFGAIITYQLRIMLYPSDTNITTVNNFQTWLSTHNTTVYYVLATPTTTEITDTTLINQLNSLELYPGVTNIFADSGNLGVNLSLHYNFVTPAPSPQRPSQINTLTGNVSLKISDLEEQQEQTYIITLPTGVELCKIGDYQDRIYKDNGVWYLEKKIGNVIFDGSNDEDWYINATSTTGKYRFATNKIKQEILSPNTNNDAVSAFCSNFSKKTASETYTLKDGLSCSTAGTLYIYYEDIAAYSIQNFKTWLSNNNITVYYVLATPTTTEITDTTLINQLESPLKSYNGQTNIYSEDAIPAYFDASALRLE